MLHTADRIEAKRLYHVRERKVFLEELQSGFSERK
jgi:hypothetical protein